MESLIEVCYKWQHRLYTLQDMIEKVKKHQLTKEQFYDITKQDYEDIMGQQD